MTDNILNRKEHEFNKNNFDILDYFAILYNKRKFIVINVLLLSLLAIPISLILPKTYIAEVVIMPPKPEAGLMSNLSLQIPSLLSLSNLVGTSDKVYSFIAILKSRRLAETIIDRYHLLERYNSRNIEEGIKSFQNNMDLAILDEGTVSVKFSVSTGFFHYAKEENESKTVCASIANDIVSEMNNIYVSLQTTQGSYNRIFIEKRLDQNKMDLMSIETQLEEFGKKYGIIALPEQLGALVTITAQIESQKIEKEIILSGLKEYLDNSHPEVRKLENEIKEIKLKLENLTQGLDLIDSPQIFPTFQKAPMLGMEYLRLQRELEVQNMIYEFLTQQYEEAKIQEAKDTPSIQVLDAAKPPIRKSKPKRIFIVFAVGLSVFFLSSTFIIIFEFKKIFTGRINSRVKNFTRHTK